MWNSLWSNKVTIRGLAVPWGAIAAAGLALVIVALALIGSGIHSSAAYAGVSRADAVGAQLTAKLQEQSKAVDATLKSQTDAVAAKTTKLEADLAALRSELTAALDKQQKADAALRGDLDKAAAATSDLGAKLSKQQEETTALRGGLEKATAQGADLATKLAKQQEEGAALRTALDKARAEQGDMATLLGKQRDTDAAIQTEARKLGETVVGLTGARDRLQLEVLLLKASGRLLRSSLHLNSQNPGLAKRDLVMAMDALDAAKSLAAEEKLRAAIGEFYTTVAELRQSIDAQAYPITTLELLSDKVEELIGK